MTKLWLNSLFNFVVLLKVLKTAAIWNLIFFLSEFWNLIKVHTFCVGADRQNKRASDKIFLD